MARARRQVGRLRDTLSALLQCVQNLLHLSSQGGIWIGTWRKRREQGADTCQLPVSSVFVPYEAGDGAAVFLGQFQAHAEIRSHEGRRRHREELVQQTALDAQYEPPLLGGHHE